MLNVQRLVWCMHRLLARRRPALEEVASDSWEICPEEKASCQRAIFLEGSLDKITAYSPWTTAEAERSRVLGGQITHASTRAHLLRNATIGGAWIYCGAYKAKHGHGSERPFRLPKSKRPRLGCVHLVSNWPGSNFFGNFLMDDLPLALVPDANSDPIVLKTKAYEHEGGYRKIFGLKRPPVLHDGQVNELIVYSDFAQNTSKALRYTELRTRLREALGSTSSTCSRNIYLKRGTTGERRLVANEEALEAHLVSLGFEIVEPTTLSAAEVSRLTLDARLVISVEGSHLSHVIYSMADSAAFLILEPPDRFATPYKDFADRMGMRFAFLVGDPASDGFSVDLDDLDRLLDRLG
ncbi:glycosyltransferase 61 family protein [Qipengyuania aquimaris]|uniref:Glycosyltransferase family 61 protein n=1 Tax=Qipengyuania aquimaris TaxID=255984 RepID=A0A9Q3S186_9SPHN|nr:glycosyltransferase family 61 protein [Qipengyuania aquimaris]MBY6218118.1 glycosyltransferase family 61 protein [Qipengyuania aquimaris]